LRLRSPEGWQLLFYIAIALAVAGGAAIVILYRNCACGRRRGGNCYFISQLRLWSRQGGDAPAFLIITGDSNYHNKIAIAGGDCPLAATASAIVRAIARKIEFNKT